MTTSRTIIHRALRYLLTTITSNDAPPTSNIGAAVHLYRARALVLMVIIAANLVIAGLVIAVANAIEVGWWLFAALVCMLVAIALRCLLTLHASLLRTWSRRYLYRPIDNLTRALFIAIPPDDPHPELVGKDTNGDDNAKV